MNDEAAAHYSAIIDNMAFGINFMQVNKLFDECFQKNICFCEIFKKILSDYNRCIEGHGNFCYVTVPQHFLYLFRLQLSCNY